MGKRERLAAQSRIGGQALRAKLLDIDLPFSVPQLAEVEVDCAAARFAPARPAQQHVARRLDQALAFDDALACVLEPAGPEVAFQNR